MLYVAGVAVYSEIYIYTKQINTVGAECTIHKC